MRIAIAVEHGGFKTQAAHQGIAVGEYEGNEAPKLGKSGGEVIILPEYKTDLTII